MIDQVEGAIFSYRRVNKGPKNGIFEAIELRFP